MAVFATAGRSGRVRRVDAGPGVVGGSGSGSGPEQTRGEIRATFEVGVRSGPDGSTVAGELALRPEFPPKPDGHRRCISVMRREAWATVFDCGAGVLPHRTYPPARWCRPRSDQTREVLALFLARSPTEGWEGERMTPTGHDRAVRRRGELARDRPLRPVSAAIDADRRWTAAPVRVVHTKADPLGPVIPATRTWRERTTSRA
jgi:hypothetical protein